MHCYPYLHSFLVILAALSLSACASNPVSTEQGYSNKQVHADTNIPGAINPTDGLRPSDIELGLLSGLVGNWEVRDQQLRKDGQWQPLNGARWTFIAIQNGRALQDEWRSFGKTEQSVSGYVNALRVFDPVTRNWQAAWLSSNDERLQLYNGEQTENEVAFTATEENKGRLTRQVFSSIRAQSFEWRIEWSKDGGQNWLTVYRAQANRL